MAAHGQWPPSVNQGLFSKKKVNRGEESMEKNGVSKIPSILLAFFTINFAVVNKTLDT